MLPVCTLAASKTAAPTPNTATRLVTMACTQTYGVKTYAQQNCCKADCRSASYGSVLALTALMALSRADFFTSFLASEPSLVAAPAALAKHALLITLQDVSLVGWVARAADGKRPFVHNVLVKFALTRSMMQVVDKNI